jgi:hypothetical protein
MSDGTEKTRIEVAFKRNGADITEYFAASPATMAQVEKALAGKTATAEMVEKALLNSGAALDRDDGPAIVMAHPDGSRDEVWYRDGERIPAPVRLEAIPGVTIIRPAPKSPKTPNAPGPA